MQHKNWYYYRNQSKVKFIELLNSTGKCSDTCDVRYFRKEISISLKGMLDLICLFLLSHMQKAGFLSISILYHPLAVIMCRCVAPRGFRDQGRRAIYFQGAGEHC